MDPLQIPLAARAGFVAPDVTAAAPLCACGRDAVDVVQVATDDGVLLLSVSAECIDDPEASEQGELFEPAEAPRRPLATMPAREDDIQPSLPLDDSSDEQREAA